MANYTEVVEAHGLQAKYEQNHIMDFRGCFELTSLEGAPDVFHGIFACSHLDLTSLVGAPSHIVKSQGGGPSLGGFLCDGLNLASLVGAPVTIDGSFRCVSKGLQSINGAPKMIKGVCTIGSPIALGSLKEFDIHFPEIHGELVIKNQVKSNILSLFKVKGLTRLTLPDKQRDVEAIVNGYLGQGAKGMMKCQLALIKAGYPELGRL